jgi:hypothetical protein
MGRLGSRAAFAGLLLPLGLCACSISQSVESVSNSVSEGLGSVSDSFKSISNSSGGGGSSSASRYRGDVRQYALASLSEAEAGGKSEFVRELGRIAELHGITDWEGDADTAAAIRDVVASGAVDAAGIARLREELAPLGEPWIDAAFAPAPAVGAAR